MHSIKTTIALLTVLFFCFSFTKSYSQQVRWGKTQISSSKMYTPYIMGEDDNFYYATSTITPEIYVEKFSKKDLTRQYSKLIKHPKIGYIELTYEGIYFMKDKFVIFASYYNSKENNSTIYAYTFNALDGSKAEDAKIVMTAPVEKLKRAGSFYVFVSKDRTKILINHAAYYKKEKCIKDKYLLLNENMEVITDKEDKVFKNEIDYRTFNFIIDNDGSVYFIKAMTNGESYIVSYDANKEYEKWEEHIDFSDLNRKTKLINLHFALNSEDDLMLAGYYTLDKKYIEGTFIMKIKTTSKEIIFKKVNAFDNAALKQLIETNSKRLLSKETPRIRIDAFDHIELQATPDGGIVLMGESVMYYGSIIFRMDVAVLAHSGEGDLLWARMVPKNQMYRAVNNAKSAKSAEYSSYLAAVKNGKLLIFINDNPKDAAKTREQIIADNSMKNTDVDKISKTTPVYYSFDLKTGDCKKSLLLPKVNEKVYLKPVLSYQKKYDSDILLFDQYKKNYKLGAFTN